MNLDNEPVSCANKKTFLNERGHSIVTFAETGFNCIDNTIIPIY